MYSSRKPVLNSEDESDRDFSSRHKGSSSFGLSSARGSSTRDRDNFTRDARDNFPRDRRGSPDEGFSRTDNFSRDTRDRASLFTRDSRDNLARDSRDRDTYSRDRDSRREPNFGSNRDFDKPEPKYGSYRNSRYGSKNSDSSDDDAFNRDRGYNDRKDPAPRRFARNSSDSEDDDKFGRSLNGSRSQGRPLSSIRGKDSMGIPDIDSYDGANQKLKMMIQWDKSLCEQLDELYESKAAKEKKIEQLKDDIHKDTVKEDGLRKKLNELRMNRKMLQSRMDEFK